MSASAFLHHVLLLGLVVSAATQVAQLPADEVQALEDIARALNMDWRRLSDPCSGPPPWIASSEDDLLTCNCTFSNNTVCHVTSISMRRQSIPGTLPPDLTKLPYLQNLDLSRSYLSGSIPPEWGVMQNLRNISLIGNRLTGPIPKEIGNMSSLKYLVLEINHLSGPLPPELGNLKKLQRLLLTSNNFTGPLPPGLAKLSSLLDIRLGDNQFTGEIPDFISSWSNLNKMVIQGSGLQGPIPSSIAALSRLTDLRISDLKGSESSFPNITATSLKILILRNCNLVGELPTYIGGYTWLKILDFSFNKLSGVIPDQYSSLDLDDLYLTENQLTGPVPVWLKRGDLSFNNFTGISECQPTRELNLFTSSSVANPPGVASCLKISRCSTKRYNLYINCGGGEVTVGSTTYMADRDVGGNARFYENTNSSWVYSSSGNFMDDSSSTDTFTTQTKVLLLMDNPQLYTNARLAPTSLTYYAYCLMTGNYMVRLHFAEIMFTNDETYSSLGRRVFNVFVQGKLVLQDFNIAVAAGGAGKDTVQNFTASVANGTLEIRFYWAGKGTNGIPERGVYGPLVSAITVDRLDVIPPGEPVNGSKRMITGASLGIILAGVALVILLIIVIIWWKGCPGRTFRTRQDLKALNLQTRSFTLRQIKVATNNFDAANKIGEGGFGPVYKGILSDGTSIAVKQLSSKSKQGTREFVNEIGMISAIQHPHLVKLYGFCIEADQLLLVYEYMENNSLARALFGSEEYQLRLDWPTRQKICMGIARGLAHLHQESRLKIVHRDIKVTNVLLDKDLSPKISDFGLAKLNEEGDTHISTRVAGTFGYMAPEYAMQGYLTDKADVYSFGIVALEIVSGRSNSSFQRREESFCLMNDWARSLKESGNLLDIVDPRLGPDFNKDEAGVMIEAALICASASSSARPSMASVVRMLEGKVAVAEPITCDGNSVTMTSVPFSGSEEEDESQALTQTQSTTSTSEGGFAYFSAPVENLSAVLVPSTYSLKRGSMTA